MEITRMSLKNLNGQMFICIFAIIGSLLLVVNGERTVDNGFDSNGVGMHDFKNLWDIYILPRLQVDLNRKISQWLEDQQNNDDESNIGDFFSDQSKSDQTDQTSTRFKRIGVAGLENLDIMTKTLDRNRLPMSVGGMNSNKLRMLMRTVGRKRK